MWDAARSFVAEHRDVSKLVEEAERFSIRLPVIGRVGVPRPDQLAFYGALGLLAAIEVIDWPVALLLGAGHAVAVRHLNGESAEGSDGASDATAEGTKDSPAQGFSVPAPTAR
ncbi:hypothetical protein H7I77_24305 [Mycolicibacterium novocastrense]|nr:hypothetical protein [Mycolicibacterium novocastrense]